MNYHKKFTKDADKIAFDHKHRQTIKFNISRYDAAVAKGKARYADLQLARSCAAYIKRLMLNNWDKYLSQFEENATKNGISVLWAKDNLQAVEYLQEILQENQAKLLVKSKSMTTEEIEMNHAAEAVGCESVETDLGEFIVQVAGEKPYHIVTPAMHKSKEDIAKLFNEKFDIPITSTPEEMTEYVRQVLRKKYTSADIGVTGANFIVADVGGIAVTENEGNGVMSTSFPKIHIVFAGMEKIIPSIKNLGLYWSLLACMGTGQQITAYNTLFTGARKNNEVDGPEKMYVILLDNGRTDLYTDIEDYEALSCIRCGACLNACPVYKTIGGYTYNTTYSGPIGSVITPFYRGFKDFGHLSSASSLCGACAEVCPEKIPLPDLLLVNRRKSVEKNLRPAAEKLAMKGFTYISGSRFFFNFPGSLKNFGAYPLNFTLWGPYRKMPKFAGKSFSQEWKKENSKK
ncbi:MAG: iron-sulfur cluster-binding protein [Bacteroidales bacterium]|jgi:L-lactate dehydrogenase complex protein LldF|nr:iron-sulfur cluster-binding protein [Bacteroidales bacterium]